MSSFAPTPEKKSRPRKRGPNKEPIDPKLQARICRAHFQHGDKYAKIRLDLEQSGIKTGDDSWFTDLTNDARKNGLIFFDVDETFILEGRELQDDGDDLRDGFNLDRAIVVQVPDPFRRPGSSSTRDSQDDQSVMRGDDHLHTVLANHAGKILARQLHSGDHCAVAGGRAVNQAVRRIRRMAPSLKDVMVTSMGGRLWSHKWWGSGPSGMRPLDPDDSAFILYLALERSRGTMFDQVGHRVFTDSPARAAAVMEEHCMFQPGGKWYDGKRPNRAIVGVGVIDPQSGHRAVRNYEGSKLVKDLMNRHLSKVRDELEGAIETVSQSRLYFGDVANRYFPTLPLPQEFRDHSVEYYDKIYGKLIKQLSDLNNRMVVVEWSHIRSIQSVTAIAGGSFKLNALWTILFAGLHSRTKPLINTLVTDLFTATDLISALDSYASLDAPAKRWYEKLVRTLFLDRPPGR